MLWLKCNHHVTDLTDLYEYMLSYEFCQIIFVPEESQSFGNKNYLLEYTKTCLTYNRNFSVIYKCWSIAWLPIRCFRWVWTFLGYILLFRVRLSRCHTTSRWILFNAIISQVNYLTGPAKKNGWNFVSSPLSLYFPTVLMPSVSLFVLFTNQFDQMYPE